jgi:hypothetical protein
MATPSGPRLAASLLLAAVAGVLLALPTAHAQASPVPCAPSGVDAQPLGVVIHVTWDETPGAESYNIYRAQGDGEFRLAATVQAPENESFDTHVEAGVTYHYRLTAMVAGVETADCGTVTATANTDPCAPELTALAENGPQVHLTWTAVVVADSYNVYRAQGEGELRLLDSTDASTQGYIDTDVREDQTYRYEVRAVIEGEERPACNTVQVTAIPDFPTWGAAVVAAAAGLGAYALVARFRRR